ncbi:MAG: response regulator transcription factor [Anaerolineae bacterium]|nr:response regulator transcription factor [Anaerolineae bacterium]
MGAARWWRYSCRARQSAREGRRSVPRIRVLIVDDHEVVRLGLRSLLEGQPGMEVVGEAASAAEAIALAETLGPDVVLMDIRLPGMSGVEACRQIKERNPRVRVLILTSYADSQLLTDAIVAGADGYVLKQVGSDALVTALRRVAAGENLLDPALTGQVFSRLKEAREQEELLAFRGLSEREMRILARIAEGKTNKEIGDELHLSEKTVRNYVSEILAKLGLSSRVQAAAYAARYHIERHAPP